MAKTTVGARPVAAETKGREIEGRTPPEILAGQERRRKRAEITRVASVAAAGEEKAAAVG